MLLFFMGLQGPLWHTIPGDDRIETPRGHRRGANHLQWHTIPGDDRIETILLFLLFL